MKTHAQALCPAHWHHSNHKFLDCRDSISFGRQKFTPLPFLCLTSTLSQPGRSPQSLSWAVHTKPQRSGSSVGVHGAAGNSCPCRGTAVLPHTGHQILLGTASYPQSWAGPKVPFLLSQNEVESSLMSPFVKPECFNSTFSLNDVVFYMKIRASKNKYPRWQQALPKDTASGCWRKSVLPFACTVSTYCLPIQRINASPATLTGKRRKHVYD